MTDPSIAFATRRARQLVEECQELIRTAEQVQQRARTARAALAGLIEDRRRLESVLGRRFAAGPPSTKAAAALPARPEPVPADIMQGQHGL